MRMLKLLILCTRIHVQHFALGVKRVLHNETLFPGQQPFLQNLLVSCTSGIVKVFPLSLVIALTLLSNVQSVILQRNATSWECFCKTWMAQLDSCMLSDTV